MDTTDLRDVRNLNGFGHTVRNLRCPQCGKVVAFHGFGNVIDAGWDTSNAQGFRAGIRLCPNPECHSILLIAFRMSESTNLTYPFEVIEFDPAGVPAEIVKSLKEALICDGAGCYRAAALMVRRTLEEICEDQRITAPNLKERLKALGTKIVIPKELIDAADELRLLGNDAAHIESREYADIGTKEIEISIMFVKEILKATYQYASLLSQLRGLKKP